MTVVGFLAIVWYVRLYIRGTLDYKEVRTQEMRRRLQAEAKQEINAKELLGREADDDARNKLIIRIMNERHQRQISYVIQDLFEKYQ